MRQSAEVLTSTPEQEIKITELGRYQIEVSQEDLQEYADAIFSISEIKKIQEGQATVSEVAKLSLEKLKGTVTPAQIEEAQRRGREIQREGTEALQQGGKEAQEFLSDSLDKIDSLGDSQSVQKAKQAVKDGAEKAKEVAGNLGFMDTMKDWSENGNFFTKMFASLMLMVAGWFGLDTKKEVIEQTREQAGDKLSIVKQEIEATLGEKFPTKQEEISQLISQAELDEEKIKELYAKLQAGEKISYQDIVGLISGVESLKFSAEDKERIREEAKTKIIQSLKEGIESEYPGTQITGEKLKKLEKLTIEYFNLSDANSVILQGIIEKKGFQYKELYGTFLEAIGKGTAFSLALISNEILPLGAVGLDVASTSLDVAKVSLGWLGVTERISFEELANNFETLENKELLLGLLYRKGGYLFSIFGKVSETVSRAGIEMVTSTNVKSFDLIKGATLNNYSQLANNFDTLAKSLGDTSGEAKIILQETFDNFIKIKNNYRVLDVLKQNSGSIEDAIQAINSLNIDNIKITSASNFDDLTRQLQGHFSLAHDGAGNTGRKIVNSLGFYGGNSEIIEINKKLQNIIDSQKSFLNKGLFRYWNKLFEVNDIAKVSRLGERIVLNFDNIEQVKKFSILANKAPELLGGIIDKLPIFTVAGLVLSKENPSFESLQNELIYLFPIVGPIMMIGEGGLQYNEETGSIEVLNPGQTAIGGVLLGLDGVFFAKALAKGPTAALGYTFKPIKDIYSIGKGGLEIGYNLSRVAKLSSLKHVIRSGIKPLTKIPRIGKMAAAIAGAGLIATEAFSSDSKEVIDQLTEEGYITGGKPNYDRIKEEINRGSLSSEEKHTLIEIIIASHALNDLDDVSIGVEEGKLKIESRNNQLKNDWFIDKTAYKYIESLFGIEYDSNDFQYIES